MGDKKAEDKGMNGLACTLNVCLFYIFYCITYMPCTRRLIDVEVTQGPGLPNRLLRVLMDYTQVGVLLTQRFSCWRPWGGKS